MTELIKGKGAVLGIGIGIIVAIQQQKQLRILAPQSPQRFRAAGSCQNTHPGITGLPCRVRAVAVHMIRSRRMDQAATGQQILQFRGGFVGSTTDNKDILLLLLAVRQESLDEEREELLQTLQQVIEENLTEQDKRVLQLHYQKEMTYAETASRKQS